MAVAERETGIFRDSLWRFNKDQYHRLADMGWFMDTPVELMDGVIVEKYPDTPTREPRPLPWTVVQYHQMALMGWFDESRVELVDGDILVMPPIGTRHMTAVMLVSHSLQSAFGNDRAISVQNSFRVGVRKEPQPDVAVLPSRIRDYANQTPTEALLIVEVSDTMLAYDRAWKMSVYAQAYVQEYWIVNLDQQQVEAYRKPELRPHDAPAFSYTETKIYRAGESIVPLAAPGALAGGRPASVD
jgi:Uma2 family endonuclease